LLLLLQYDAIVSTGIKIVNRVEIPPEMVPVRLMSLSCRLIVVFFLLRSRVHLVSLTRHHTHSFDFGHNQADAMVEITAKVFHGYNAGDAYKNIDEEELKRTKGREYGYDKKTQK
jgi:hypothetical protein